MGKHSRVESPKRRESYTFELPLSAAMTHDGSRWLARSIEFPEIEATAAGWEEARDIFAAKLRGSFRHAPPPTGIQRPVIVPLSIAFTTFDLAALCFHLGEDGSSGEAIAATIAERNPDFAGLDGQHVNNLRRAYRKLAPGILKDWEAGDPRATTMFVFELAGLDDQQEQRQRWNERGRGTPSGSPGAPARP